MASVSCIYGLGEKKDYEALGKKYTIGQKIKRNELLKELIRIQYLRNDVEFKRGSFRVKGENVDVYLATGEAVVRISLFGDYIDKILVFTVNPGAKGIMDLRTKDAEELKGITILPAKHYMTPNRG